MLGPIPRALASGIQQKAPEIGLVSEGPTVQAACGSFGLPNHRTLAAKEAKGRGGQGGSEQEIDLRGLH